MKYVLAVSLLASVLGFSSGSMAREWSTPEALRAFGAPGDTVGDPANAEKNRSPSADIGKSKKQSPVETDKESNLTTPFATADSRTMDTRLEEFKSVLVNAYSHPDPERIRMLMFPESRACLSAEPKYERFLLRAETMQAIPRDAKISIEAVAATAVLPFRGFRFPQRPSHVVRMEYGKNVSSDGRSSTTQIAEKYIAHVNGRWYLILPCPTPDGLSRLRKMGLLD